MDAQHLEALPFLFEFEIKPVRWIQSALRIVGWARRQDGRVDGSYLMAEIAEIEGHPIRYSRRDLPEELLHDLSVEACTDKDLERALSDFEPSVLLPCVAEVVEPSEERQLADAWQMRREFLRVQPTGRSFAA